MQSCLKPDFGNPSTFWQSFSQTGQYGLSELLLSGIKAVERDMGMPGLPRDAQSGSGAGNMWVAGSDGCGISDVRAIS